MDAVRLLANTPFFAGAPETSLQELAERSTIRSHSKGAHVCRQGDLGNAILVVVTGGLKLVTVSIDGDEVLLATVGPGEAFGELAALDHGPRTASAITLEMSTVLSVPGDAVLSAMAAHPALLQTVTSALTSLARRATDQRCDLIFHDLPGRVAKTLLELAGSDGYVWPQLNQAELALMAGGTRQSINQTLKSFEQLGWIAIDRRSIRINDRVQLAQRVLSRD